MNTTLYVSKAGEQIYSDASQWASQRGLSLSKVVETLLDLATCAKTSKAFQREVNRAIVKAQTESAVVSKRPAKKVARR